MFARSSTAIARPAHRRRLLASPALTVVALAIAGAGSVVLAADASVGITNLAYNPASVTINVGDSVTWTNNDDVPHTATGNGGSFDTGNLGTGDSGAVTFNTAGSFPYRCSIHPQMAGTVTVQGAAATPAPPGATPRPTTPGTDIGLAAAPPPSTDGAGIVIFGMAVLAFALAIRIVGRRAPR